MWSCFFNCREKKKEKKKLWLFCSMFLSSTTGSTEKTLCVYLLGKSKVGLSLDPSLFPLEIPTGDSFRSGDWSGHEKCYQTLLKEVPDCQGEFPWPHINMTWGKLFLHLDSHCRMNVNMRSYVPREPGAQSPLMLRYLIFMFPLLAPCLLSLFLLMSSVFQGKNLKKC